MKCKTALWLFLVSLPLSSFSQVRDELLYKISTIQELNLRLDSLVLVKNDIKYSDDVTIYFNLKIDSLGEVHSAHVIKKNNFNDELIYDVVNYIETYFNLRFLFDDFRYKYPGHKYVFVSFKYKSLRN
jgi:hypothetical protein